MSNDQKPSEVYLLHFDRPYWKQARHYVGYTTKSTAERVDVHRSGKGSLLVNYAHNKQGIPFQVGLVEQFATRVLARWREKKLKREGHLARHCEICKKGGHRVDV